VINLAEILEIFSLTISKLQIQLLLKLWFFLKTIWLKQELLSIKLNFHQLQVSAKMVKKFQISLVMFK